MSPLPAPRPTLARATPPATATRALYSDPGCGRAVGRRRSGGHRRVVARRAGAHGDDGGVVPAAGTSGRRAARVSGVAGAAAGRCAVARAGRSAHAGRRQANESGDAGAWRERAGILEANPGGSSGCARTRGVPVRGRGPLSTRARVRGRAVRCGDRSGGDCAGGGHAASGGGHLARPGVRGRRSAELRASAAGHAGGTRSCPAPFHTEWWVFLRSVLQPGSSGRVSSSRRLAGRPAGPPVRWEGHAPGRRRK